MTRRVLTAREQAEMTTPWRTADMAGLVFGDPTPLDHDMDIANARQLWGVVHTTGGRRLPIDPQRLAAAIRMATSFDDPRGWSYHKSFDPFQGAIQGAQAYNRQAGLADPFSGATDYLNAMRLPDETRSVAQAYDALPTYDPSATKHFDAMRSDVNKQFDFATNRMGIRPQFVDHDPYPDTESMLQDIRNNNQLQVLRTSTTGSHPYFTDDENDRFRFVHDLFGHAGTGRSFDRHGEQAAYLAHAQMFSPEALPALSTETRGQNSSLIFNGDFQPQKVATMGREHWGQLPSGLSVPGF